MEDRLDDLRKLDPAVLAAVLRFVWGTNRPPRLRDLVDAGSDGPALLADRFGDYWDRVLADVWPRMIAVLEADIRQRSAALSDAGMFQLRADLHRQISVHDGGDVGGQAASDRAAAARIGDDADAVHLRLAGVDHPGR